MLRSMRLRSISSKKEIHKAGSNSKKQADKKIESEIYDNIADLYFI